MSWASLKEKYWNERGILIGSVFIAGLCSLIYELLISTASSYFLGDSIKQFSITIGLYMAAMGGGSYLSRFFKANLLSKFIGLEILLGFVGGMCIPLLYATYAFTDFYYPASIFFIILIGILTGLEVPLLTRIMEKNFPLSINLSNVLSLDYLGALAATMAFPFLLLPFLGTFRTSLVFGMVNMGIGFLNLWFFSDILTISKKKVLYLATVVVTVFLGAILFFTGDLLNLWTNAVYEDRVVYAKQSKYQKIVLTKYKKDIRLYLDGNLQFSSLDEYRYHESLVHIPLSLVQKPSKILVLGGGDGLVSRELLKYNTIDSIKVVDLDPQIFKLAKNNPHVVSLNDSSLHHPKVETVSHDAMVFLENLQKEYDAIIADLPDPNNASLARLYSTGFYKMIRTHLKPGGVFVTQSTSPFYAQKAFWSINKSIKEAGFKRVLPYHVYIPSFGDWGFNMAWMNRRIRFPDTVEFTKDTRFLGDRHWRTLMQFSPDLRQDTAVEASTIDRPKVLEYYLKGWEYWK